MADRGRAIKWSRENTGVCVCDLLFNIPLYAAQTGYDSGSAEGGGALFFRPFSQRNPGRPAFPVIVTHIYQQKEKTKETSPRPERKGKQEKPRPILSPTMHHAARLARGPFLLPQNLPGTYSRVTSTPIFARPVDWAGSVSAGRSSPLSSWWWRLPPPC